MGKRVLSEEQLQSRREYNKEYRKTHSEIERERQKRYIENNPDKLKERRQRYRENNPNCRKQEYDRKLEKLGKTRKPILTDEEREAKRLEQKEKAKLRANEHYKNNFVSVEKICKYCGTPFMTQYKKSKYFCSEECARKNQHYQRKLADKRRHGKIINLDRLDSNITLPLLYERDNGICKLCGKPCDFNDYTIRDGVVIVGNNYPSIDHIKPISKGGPHTWDNVQLAHKYCNSLKSNTY